MSKRILTITWKPDVLSMVEHNGSKKMGKHGWIYDYSKGLTSRSERESYWNVKTREKAEAIVNRRNKNQMIVAKWGESVIYPEKTA